jgi:hypothetical protein
MSRPSGQRESLAGGLDLKAGLGSHVTIDATVNPDFGQVEADPAVLNLSAFEIRFDERRPFFQEGAGLYRCSGACEGIFYTRRIGRTPQMRRSNADALFTNITAAAKITGRFDNGLAFGVVNATTENVRGADGTTIVAAGHSLAWSSPMCVVAATPPPIHFFGAPRPRCSCKATIDSPATDGKSRASAP